MNRISGPMAVFAGLVLMIPGLFALLYAASDAAAMPGWLVRDLIVASLSGAALLYWGAALIRNRELQLHELDGVRVRSRR